MLLADGALRSRRRRGVAVGSLSLKDFRENAVGDDSEKR